MQCIDEIPDDAHVAIFGRTRVGKSVLLELMTRIHLANGLDGLLAVDPHGAYARAIAEDWCGNPNNPHHNLPVTLLDPASENVFGLNPLAAHVDTPEGYNDAALLLLSVVENFFDAKAIDTPRLMRILYVVAYLSASKKLSPIDMLGLLALGGDEIRRALLHDFDNMIIKRELEDLSLLAQKYPAKFLEYVESTRNRFVVLAGDRRVARVLAHQTIDPRAVMDRRERLFLDLSGMPPQAKSFLGMLFTTAFVAAAHRRPPKRSAFFRLILDEAESMICTATASMLDTCAKFNLTLVAAVQRFGQLKAKGPYIFDSFMINTPVKFWFALPDPDTIDYATRSLACGYLDLQEFKPLSARPIAVGSDLQIVHAQSIAAHRAQQHMRAHTEMRAHATGKSLSRSSGQARGSGDAAGDSQSMLLTPPWSMAGPNADNASWWPTPLSQSQGESNSRNSFEQSSEAQAIATSEIESTGEADTTAYGTMDGQTVGQSVSEQFVTRYEDYPITMFSLEEQRERFGGALTSLQPRECFVKIEGRAPFKIRTADLEPAWRSRTFKELMLPLHKAALARSPYLRPTQEIDRLIPERLDALTKPAPTPDSNFTAAEPVPTVQEAAAFAEDFWRTRKIPNPNDEPPKPKPKKPKGRRPVGTDLGADHDRFRVIDGDGDKRK